MWLIRGRDVEVVPQVDAAQELVVVVLVAVVLAMEVAEPEVMVVVGDAGGDVEADVEEVKFFAPIYFGLVSFPFDRNLYSRLRKPMY